MSLRLDVAFWAKAIATGVILTIVLWRVDLSAASATLSHIKVSLFLLGLGLACPLGFTGVQRWRCVAATFGEELSLSKAFMYSWIGQFINLGLPTVLGLDSVRAWKMHKQGLPIGLATRVVIVDRLCSLATLLVLIALAMPHLVALSGSEIFEHSAILAFVLGSAGLVGLSASELIARVVPTTGRARHLYQLSTDFNHALFGNAIATTRIVSWSICNHLCRVVMVFCLALALDLSMTPLEVFALAPSALLLAMAPISLAGWGVREVVFIQAFSLADVAPSDALALSILYGLVGLLTGLFGGVVWFAERKLQGQRSTRHA